MLTLQLNQQIEKSKVYLSKIAHKFTSDPEEAQDLIQETLIRSINHTEGFLNNSKVGSWLYVIMKNVYINQYRKQQKRRQYEHAEISSLLDQGCSEPFTFNQVEDRFAATDIKRAMSALSQENYEIFNMYIEGYKYREIADHYAMPEGTIKTRIFHTKKALRKSLAAYEISKTA